MITPNELTGANSSAIQVHGHSNVQLSKFTGIHQDTSMEIFIFCGRPVHLDSPDFLLVQSFT